MSEIFLIPPEVLQNSSDPPSHLIIKVAELVSVFEAEIDHPLGLLKVKAGNLIGTLTTDELIVHFTNGVKLVWHKIEMSLSTDEF